MAICHISPRCHVGVACGASASKRILTGAGSSIPEETVARRMHENHQKLGGMTSMQDFTDAIGNTITAPPRPKRPSRALNGSLSSAHTSM